MGNMRFNDERWEEITKKEYKLSMKAKKMIKKSEIINLIIDNCLQFVEYENGKLEIKMKPER